ncbi:MAG: DUF294 nucleotidyltransferase-like domain-containing protein [Nostocoides sp.]
MALDVELAEVRDFLSGVRPFDALPPVDLEATVRALSVRYFRRGTDIIAIGEDNHALFVVRSGAVDIFDDQGNLADRGDVGTVFGSITLVQGNPSTFDVTAIEDTLCLVLPEAAFHDLRSRHKDVARFFDLQRASRMRGAVATLQMSHSGDAILRTRVRDLVRHAPITATTTATIREAAQIMTASGVSCLLIMDRETLVGIVTDRDLRRRVVATGVDIDAPVTSVMTANPITGHEEAMAFEVLLDMANRTIHHLPIVRDQKPVGVVTTTDLMRLEQANPVYVSGDIAKQTSVAGVATLATRLPRIVEGLARQDASADDIGRIVTAVGDAVERALITLAEAELGPPPVPYAWVVLGSRARLEQGLATDQDNAMVLSDDYRPEHADYFRKLAAYVVDGLVTCGYPRCAGDIMATNDRWRVPLSTWRGYVRTWVEAPTPQAVLRASIFLDQRAVVDESDLHTGLVEDIRARIPSADRFLAHLARDAISQEPPLGFFRGLVLDKDEHADTFDIKKGGLAAVVKLARVHALRLGSSAVNTQARIAAAAAAGAMDLARAEDLRDAFEYLSYVRLRHQARQVRAGGTPDNFVNPEELSAFDQSHLRDAFAIVRAAQKVLGSGSLG